MSLRNRLLDLLRLKVTRSSRPAAASVDLATMAAQLGRPVRVAVIRLDGIGDWILTLPLVSALAASAHVESLTLVGLSAHAGLLGGRPDSTFLPYRAGSIVSPPWPGGLLGKVRAASWLGQREALAHGGAHRDEFDLVVVPRWDIDFGFNARAWASATGASTVGHDPRVIPRAAGKEVAEVSLLDVVVSDPRPSSHDSLHLDPLLAALGLSRSLDASAGRAFFAVESVAGAGFIALHTRANEPKREWPIASWRALIVQLQARYDLDVVLIGAPQDLPRHEAIMAGFGDRVRSVAGAVSLHDLPSYLATADAFIGNDSGPAHVASSVGTAAVVVSPHPLDGDPAHRNSPARFGPLGEHSVVVQPVHATTPCTDACMSHHPHCIAGVTIPEVLAALGRVAPTLRRAGGTTS